MRLREPGAPDDDWPDEPDQRDYGDDHHPGDLDWDDPERDPPDDRGDGFLARVVGGGG